MIAEGFVAQGARVYISSRKADVCDRTAAELSAGGGTCISLPMDVSAQGGVRNLAAAYAAREPRLDILVNNAGAAWLAAFDDFPEKGWDKVMDLNVRAPFFLTQALAPSLRAAASPQRPAKVINIASIDGIYLTPNETYSYAASKSGLLQLTRLMAARLIKQHIAVTAIAPGPFKSDMNIRARDHELETAARVPARRVGNDLDIAGAAIFLASRAGDYVVGSAITVDGGVAFATSSALVPDESLL